MSNTELNIRETFENTENGEIQLALKSICQVLAAFNKQIELLKTDVDKLVENVR
jgi:hypothetical protein